MNERIKLMVLILFIAELLRKSSEQILVEMVQLLFTRLPQFKEDAKWSANMRKVRLLTCSHMFIT